MGDVKVALVDFEIYCLVDHLNKMYERRVVNLSVVVRVTFHLAIRRVWSQVNIFLVVLLFMLIKVKC